MCIYIYMCVWGDASLPFPAISFFPGTLASSHGAVDKGFGSTARPRERPKPLGLGEEVAKRPCGYGSKLSRQGTADSSSGFHLPGFHVGHLCLTQSHIALGPWPLFGRKWPQKENPTRPIALSARLFRRGRMFGGRAPSPWGSRSCRRTPRACKLP